MLKKHPLMLSSLLLTASLTLHGQETASNSEILNISSRAFAPFTGAIRGSKVRMRIQPSLEGHVVRETTAGELFVIAEEVGDYYAIVPPKDCKGYVFRTFILDGVVEGERVNVRLYPDIDAPVIGQLNTGDRVIASVSDANNKWLEVALPETSRFFVAKDYIEKKGPAEYLSIVEKKRNEAAHHLSSASLFAQAEIQKSFEQIDLDAIQQRFSEIAKQYKDLPAISEQVQEVTALMQEIYLQKKIAFLEHKAGQKTISSEISPDQLDKLAKCGIEITTTKQTEIQPLEMATAATETLGWSTLYENADVTDKMLVWAPLEESIYHLWAASNGDLGIEAFYDQERASATVISGIVEPYNRPVKNRPGDFLLKSDNLPVAFLYSTQVNLERFVGQKITLQVTSRPNHNFAFPAYYVLSVE